MLLIGILITSEDWRRESAAASPYSKTYALFPDRLPRPAVSACSTTTQIRSSIARRVRRARCWTPTTPCSRSPSKPTWRDCAFCSIFGGVYADLGCFFVQKWAALRTGAEAGEAAPVGVPRFSQRYALGHFAVADRRSGRTQGARQRHRVDLRPCQRALLRSQPALSDRSRPVSARPSPSPAKPEDLIVGDSYALNPEQVPGIVTQRCHSFIMGAHVIAFKRKRYASLSELGRHHRQRLPYVLAGKADLQRLTPPTARRPGRRAIRADGASAISGENAVPIAGDCLSEQPHRRIPRRRPRRRRPSANPRRASAPPRSGVAGSRRDERSPYPR